MNTQHKNTGAWVFYVVFIAVFVAEGAFVDICLKVSKNQLGVAWLGPWLAWAVFVVGAVLLAFGELALTKPHQEHRDPLLRAGCWAQRRYGYIGFVANTAVLAPLATAVALKHVDHPAQMRLCVVSAVLWSTMWVPIFVHLLP